MKHAALAAQFRMEGEVMVWSRRFWLRLHGLFGRNRNAQRLDDEIQFHLEQQIAENIAAGMDPDEARYAALRVFGNPTALTEETRDTWGWVWLEQFVQDLRHGARVLRKDRGFTAVAVLTLSLGLGANAAIFQLLDAVRLRSLPVANPQQLVEVRVPEANGVGVNVGDNPQMTNPLWEEFRDHQEAFSGVFAWGTDTFRISEGASAHNVHGLWVSGGFFPILGISPFRGRLLDSQDDHHGCGPSVAVISYGLWQREYGGLDSVIDSDLTIQDHSFRVIGVTPPSFSGLDIGTNFDVALPICSLETVQSSNASFGRRDVWWLTVMGRLKPGWTFERASAYLGTISPGLFQATVPTGYQASTLDRYLKLRLAAYPGGKGVSPLRRRFDTFLWLLLAITGLVLLIACANLANLMLARATTREHEIAVRLAMGASRRRLVQQLLSESVLLAFTGTLLGVYLARVLSHVIVWFMSTERYVLQLDLSLDWRVITFTASAAVLTCVIFGLAPALRSSQAELSIAMKAGSRNLTGGRERFSFQRLLVASQIAISLVLLFSAFLLVRSFRNLMTFDPGFREQGVLLVQIDIRKFVTSGQISPLRLKPLQHELLDESRAIPQVQSAAMSTHVPLDGSSWTLGFLLNDVSGSSKFTWVSSEYFETMQIPVLEGRNFNDRDTESSPRVALVNETFVRNYCGGASPIGKAIRTIAEPRYPAATYEIIGVVRDTKYASLREAIPPQVFGAGEQYPSGAAWGPIFIRSSAPLSSVISAVKERLNSKYPTMQLDFQIFQTQIQDRLVIERLMAALSGFFGALATTLAIIGLYGVLSYIVIRRRTEIGIRVALGAHGWNILSVVLGHGAKLTAMGVGLGVAAALPLTRLMRSLLFGISPMDPRTFASVTLLLTFVAIAACCVPAWRASRVDPMQALRSD